MAGDCRIPTAAQTRWPGTAGSRPRPEPDGEAEERGERRRLSVRIVNPPMPSVESYRPSQSVCPKSGGFFQDLSSHGYAASSRTTTAVRVVARSWATPILPGRPEWSVAVMSRAERRVILGARCRSHPSAGSRGGGRRALRDRHAGRRAGHGRHGRLHLAAGVDVLCQRVLGFADLGGPDRSALRRRGRGQQRPLRWPGRRPSSSPGDLAALGGYPDGGSRVRLGRARRARWRRGCRHRDLPCRRVVLYHSIHSATAISTSSMPRQWPFSART